MDFPKGVQVEVGRAERLPNLPRSADFVFCNSVFLGGGITAEVVTASLEEFRRNIVSGGLLFIGELPDCLEDGQKGWSFVQEFAGLFRLVKARSYRKFRKRSLNFARGLFSSRFEIVTRAPGFAMRSSDFVRLVEEAGFSLLGMYHSETAEQLEPKAEAWEVRLDYLFQAT